MNKLNKILAIAGLTALSTLASNESTKEYSIIPGLITTLGAGAYYQVKREEKQRKKKREYEHKEKINDFLFRGPYAMVILEKRDGNNFERKLEKIEKLKVYNLYDNTVEYIYPQEKV